MGRCGVAALASVLFALSLLVVCCLYTRYNTGISAQHSVQPQPDPHPSKSINTASSVHSYYARKLAWQHVEGFSSWKQQQQQQWQHYKSASPPQAQPKVQPLRDYQRDQLLQYKQLRGWAESSWSELLQHWLTDFLRQPE